MLLFEGQTLLVLFAVITCVVLFFIWRPRSSLSLTVSENISKYVSLNGSGDRKTGNPEEKVNYTACTSSECVRCVNYQLVRTEASEKLKYYIAKTKKSRELTRLLLAFSGDGAKPRKFTLQNPNVFFLPGLAAKMWWTDCLSFSSDKARLMDNFHTIIEEFKLIYTSYDARYWKTNSTQTGSWDVFCFYNQGKKITENCHLCPKTTALIESLPMFIDKCVFGNALFSVLQPGTTIEEHYGPCNLRIRCHLGLNVPPGYKLTVGKETRCWTKGECILFDDSFLHSVEHDGTSDRVRVILLVDLWHPYLTIEERSALEAIF